MQHRLIDQFAAQQAVEPQLVTGAPAVDQKRRAGRADPGVAQRLGKPLGRADDHEVGVTHDDDRHVPGDLGADLEDADLSHANLVGASLVDLAGKPSVLQVESLLEGLGLVPPLDLVPVVAEQPVTQCRL